MKVTSDLLKQPLSQALKYKEVDMAGSLGLGTSTLELDKRYVSPGVAFFTRANHTVWDCQETGVKMASRFWMVYRRAMREKAATSIPHFWVIAAGKAGLMAATLLICHLDLTNWLAML